LETEGARRRRKERMSAMTQDQHAQQDPTMQYPQPVFPQQPLEHPGLESEMDPRPDYDQDTYRGSGKLTGKTAIITGGDSGIGRAVALAFAREGADVLISYLESEESDAQETVRAVEGSGKKAVASPATSRMRPTANRSLSRPSPSLARSMS
jgi:predicted ATP-dependent serine protease